jgi:hypothetical protein
MYQEDDGGQYAAMQESAARDEYEAECDARGQAEAECQAAAFEAEQQAAQEAKEQAQTSYNSGSTK